MRPLRLRSEKERLGALFDEVYRHSRKVDKTLPRQIELYIQESMDINAFAFGKSTLILTKGSIDLLSDDDIKGLIAHELGHFSNRDTMFALIATVANLPMTFTLMLLSRAKLKMDEASKESITVKIFKGFFDTVYYIFKAIEFIGDLILMSNRRENEYKADMYALECGYGVELADVLTEIYQVSMEKPRSVKELVKSTHPHITKRIERLEGELY